MSSARVRLIDVAERAGVSRATASLVLNGRHDELRISRGTQERVHHAAAELGYRPNLAAQGLPTRTSRTVGMVLDTSTSEPFPVEMLRGAASAAQEQGYLLVVGETGGDASGRRHVVDGMLDRQVDGLLYASAATRVVDLSELAHDRPVVLLNCTTDPLPGPAVVPHSRQAGLAAARALVDSGHRDRIYVLRQRGPTGSAPRERLEGVDDGLRRAGVELAGLLDCDAASPATTDRIGQLVVQAQPTALVCVSDHLAVGVYQALAAHGMRVPDDVSVLSFDGSDVASWLSPQLTSIAPRWHEMGRLATELLIKGEPDRVIHRIDLAMLVGGSVAAPKV